jgi:hypothetical protein
MNVYLIKNFTILYFKTTVSPMTKFHFTQDFNVDLFFSDSQVEENKLEVDKVQLLH